MQTDKGNVINPPFFSPFNGNCFLMIVLKGAERKRGNVLKKQNWLTQFNNLVCPRIGISYT
ncbi:MAG TPA: hypothetical protein DD730_09880 [Desulfosporosinus sp.]|nr:hypothetical protein [Desulfosporosinus sp.]